MTQLPLGPPEFEGRKPTEVAAKITGNAQLEGARTRHLEDRVVIVVVGKVGEISHRDLAEGFQRLQKVKAEKFFEVDDDEAAELVDRLEKVAREAAGERRLPLEDEEPPAPGPEISVDETGTVLTDDEKAAIAGVPPSSDDEPPGPSIDEALAWWEAPSDEGGPDFPDKYVDWDPDEVCAFLETATAEQVDFIEALEHRWDDAESMNGDDCYEPDPRVAEVIAKRRDYLNRKRILEDDLTRRAIDDGLVDAEGFYDPTIPSPLEKGLPIAEVRARLAKVTDRRTVADWIAEEEHMRAGATPKRLVAALNARLAELDAAT